MNAYLYFGKPQNALKENSPELVITPHGGEYTSSGEFVPQTLGVLSHTRRVR